MATGFCPKDPNGAILVVNVCHGVVDGPFVRASSFRYVFSRRLRVVVRFISNCSMTGGVPLDVQGDLPAGAHLTQVNLVPFRHRVVCNAQDAPLAFSGGSRVTCKGVFQRRVLLILRLSVPNFRQFFGLSVVVEDIYFLYAVIRRREPVFTVCQDMGRVTLMGSKSDAFLVDPMFVRVRLGDVSEQGPLRVCLYPLRIAIQLNSPDHANILVRCVFYQVAFRQEECTRFFSVQGRRPPKLVFANSLFLSSKRRRQMVSWVNIHGRVTIFVGTKQVRESPTFGRVPSKG